MELKTIQQLVQLMRRGDVAELEIDDPATGLRVRLKRGVDAPLPGPAAPVVHVTHGGPGLTSPGLVAHAPAAAAAAEAAAAAPAGRPFLSPNLRRIRERGRQRGTKRKEEAPLRSCTSPHQMSLILHLLNKILQQVISGERGQQRRKRKEEALLKSCLSHRQMSLILCSPNQTLQQMMISGERRVRGVRRRRVRLPKNRLKRCRRGIISRFPRPIL